MKKYIDFDKDADIIIQLNLSCK